MLTAAPNQMLLLLLMMMMLLQLLLMQEVSGQCTAPLVCRPCANTGDIWVMDCGSAQLTAVPSFTSFPATLAVLSLRSNNIATLQDSAFLPQGGGLLKVRRLDFTSNPIASIAPTAFNGLEPSLLTELLLDVRQMTSFPVQALQAFTNLTMLNITGFRLTSLPSGALQPFTSLRVLKLATCGLQQLLPSDVSSQQTSLTSLTLDGNSMSAPPTAALATLKALLVISMSSMSINGLTSSAFSGISGLASVDLSFNRLQTIDPLAFTPVADTLQSLTLISCQLADPSALRSLSKLKYLDVSNNVISSLPSQTFSLMSSLVQLHLGSNRLTSISNASFSGLEMSLKELVMSSNAIATVEAGTFQQFQALQMLDLSNQNLSSTLTSKTFVGLEATLRQLKLSAVFFGSSHWPAISSLRSLLTLTLDHNVISEIADDSFDNLNRLQQLDLSYNALTNVTQRQMRTLRNSLITAYLDHNNINTVDNCTFAGFSMLHTLVLDHNPLQCDCALIWLLERVHADEQGFIYNYTCATPPNLAGRQLTDLTASNLTCTSDGYQPTVCESDTGDMGLCTLSLYDTVSPDGSSALVLWNTTSMSIVGFTLEYFISSSSSSSLNVSRVTVNLTADVRSYTIVVHTPNEDATTSYVSVTVTMICNTSFYALSYANASVDITLTRQSSVSSATTAIIVGCVVGGVALLCILAVVLVCSIRACKRRGKGVGQGSRLATSVSPQAGADTKKFSRPRSHELQQQYPSGQNSGASVGGKLGGQGQGKGTAEEGRISGGTGAVRYVNEADMLEHAVPIDPDNTGGQPEPDQYHEIPDEHFSRQPVNLAGTADVGARPSYLPTGSNQGFTADVDTTTAAAAAAAANNAGSDARQHLGFINAAYVQPEYHVRS